LAELEQHLRNCRWFERGWTLQELLAPKNVTFCSVNWKLLGKRDYLSGIVAKITGIRNEVLVGDGSNLGSFSIAEKMSWASKRKTTEPEDTAHCLMGIFEVNMPLLYGEGDKAFVRLQEEIINNSDDQTVFAGAVRAGLHLSWPLHRRTLQKAGLTVKYTLDRFTRMKSPMQVYGSQADFKNGMVRVDCFFTVMTRNILVPWSSCFWRELHHMVTIFSEYQI
jgi:hypothetical protein